MSTTKENLENAFAGESMANRKYLAFAKKAKKYSHTFLKLRYFVFNHKISFLNF